MNGAERSVVQFGGTQIEYAIRRSRRRGTVSIAVDPAEGVVLTSPSETPVEKLDRLVHLKAPWIVRRLRRQSDVPPAPAREFVSGETYLYFGRQYRLRLVVDSPEVGPICLRAGWLHLRVPHGLKEAHRAGYVRAALIDWYQRRAAERLPEQVYGLAERMRLPVRRVAIRDQKARWASCDARGVVRLNWRIVQAARSCIEYVIAHELVHLEHRDHSPEFWAQLGRTMPDYEQRRQILRGLGPRLVW
jgi:predicted metal-dependent hydrolase